MSSTEDLGGQCPRLRSRSGGTIELEVTRWHADADEAELALLTDLQDPVLDVGCGPGRIVAALAAHGRAALGVDVSELALAAASRRGAAVLGRSVFAPLPGEGRWPSIVLLDGNIGIGGDPAALLARVRELLAPGGTTLVEVEPPGVTTGVTTVRVERDGRTGPWFDWAHVSVDDIGSLLATAGLRADRIERRGTRWFAFGSRP